MGRDLNPPYTVFMTQAAGGREMSDRIQWGTRSWLLKPALFSI